MYAIATCNVKITRGTSRNAAGDTVAADTTVVTESAAASISELSNRYWDAANQVPRTVRSLEMLVSSAVDVQPNDRVHDLTFDVKYVVQDVTQSRGPMFTPDKVCTLKRVN